MIEIGETIRALRSRKKASIKAFSEETGLSVSHLSKIERGLVSPSLDALEKIAAAFQVPVTTLFSSTPTRNPVTRREDRIQIHLPGRIVESLNNSTDNSFGAYFCWEGDDINGSKGKAATAEKYFTHRGDELIHVLEGEMIFTVGPDEYALKEGDSIFFDASIAHCAKRISPRLKLLIITNPSTPLSNMGR